MVEGIPVYLEPGLAVAEALERLAHVQKAPAALAAHKLEIHLDGDHLVLPPALVKDLPGRVDDPALPVTAHGQPVDVEDVALEHRGRSLGNAQIRRPVDESLQGPG